MHSINFTIDKTPPTVSITNPINRSFVGNIVNIAGIASDLHMEKISLEIDGIMVSNSVEYSWIFSIMSANTPHLNQHEFMCI